MRSRLSFKYFVVSWFVVRIILGCYDFRDWNRGFDGLGGIRTLNVGSVYFNNIPFAKIKQYPLIRFPIRNLKSIFHFNNFILN